jgi:hypothetical protein
MGKFNQYEVRQKPRSQEIHPAWRGIGCIMILIVPVISFAGANVFLEIAFQQGWPLPVDLLGYPQVSETLFLIPFVSYVAAWLANFNNFYAIMLFTLAILLLLSGVLSFVYASLYRMFGPPRYTALDAPASKRRPSQKSR